MLCSDWTQSGSGHAGAPNCPCDGAGVAAGGPGPADDHLQVSPHRQSTGSVCQTPQELHVVAVFVAVFFFVCFDVLFTGCITIRPGGGGP